MIEQSVFYLEAFSIFKKSITRYHVLPEAIFQEIITHNLKPSNQYLRIADLGCGDLVLTIPLLEKIKNNLNFTIKVDLVDNSQRFREYYEKLLKNSKTILTEKNSCWHSLGMTEYLNILQENSKDFILCSHSLYYLSLSSWQNFVQKAFRCLTKKGMLCIVLRSRKAQWEQVFDPMIQEAKVTIDPSYIHAEDFLLEWIPKYCFVKSVPYNLSIASDEDLFRIVEFLYRLPKLSLTKETVLGNNILQVAKLYLNKENYVFSLIDKMFVISNMYQ